MYLNIYLQSLLITLVLATRGQPNVRAGQPVRTTSGLVFGHSSSWQPNVSEYLGIPYAQPPIKQLRFEAPRPYYGAEPIFATKFSPDCPANGMAPPNSSISYESVADTIFSTLIQAGDSFSEDCLTLNVWAKPHGGPTLKPVMIWIYGGGFTSGSTANPAYNGARLVDSKDVVVVSINYRVGIFGFPGFDKLPSLNLGLLDQRLAVEWVRNNIAHFGGDPDRITLFGQSAGGQSVDFYSFAWTEDPIVSGFIIESGFAYDAPAANMSGWFNTSLQLDCGGPEAGIKTLECMKTKSYMDILSAVQGYFGPTADNRIVWANYTSQRIRGAFVKRAS
ncbi:alpha/beta-hydrolase [Penicillium lagena]|uniref:alpha/beta-hydrolase n=1 Tax=Penicillium lagena TaxID=94218 RepID=UPI0025423534|nr:alpha/beta-hydrolase [Penicillium lagena]KAJ5604443.1 alpha/beta-hydrolase [Penicillium lagena]